MKYIGLNRDVSNSDVPEGYGIDAKNGINSKLKGASINEDGFKIFQKSNASASKKYGLPFTISSVSYIRHWIGEIVINNNRTVVFSIGYRESCGTFSSPTINSVFSEIGVLDEFGEYVTVINDLSFTAQNKLNFKADKAIRGEFTVNYYNQVIVAATDADNFPLYINIDYYITNPPTPSFNINTIKMFPDVNQVNVNAQVEDYGGSLPNGVYYLSFKHENEDLSSTNSLITANPIYIFDSIVGNSTANFTQVEGDMELKNTSKLIRITVSNLNTSFNKLSVYAVVKRNGQSFSYFLKTVNITSSTITFELTNVEETEITLKELLIPSAVFKKVYTFTQVYNRLYALRPTYNSIRNYQKWANNITIGWTSELIDPFVQTPAKTENNRDKKTFQHREVYAFNIHLELTDGSLTEGFHIPWNHIVKDSDITSAGYRNTSTKAADQGINCKKFQIEDTCTLGISLNPNATGFWENQDELYPDINDFDIWGVVSGVETNLSALNPSNPNYKENLRNKKIRHHRMPSISYLKQNLYSTTQEYGLSKLDRLGIDVRNVYIPDELKPFVKGWVISFCERNYNNSTVIGQSTLEFASTSGNTYSGVKKYPDVWSSGMNSAFYGKIDSGATPFFTLPVTPFIVNTTPGYNIKESIVRFFDTNIIKNQPDIAPTFIANELFLQSVFDFKNIVNLNGSNPYNGNNAITVLNDYTGKLNGKTIGTDILAKTVLNIAGINVEFRKVKNYKYLPARVIDGRYDNQTSEDSLVLEIDSDTLSGSLTHGVRSIPIYLDTTTGLLIPLKDWGFGTSGWVGQVEQTYLSSLMALPSNVYSSLQNQKIVITGEYFNSSISNAVIYKGDSFISNNGYHNVGWGGCPSNKIFATGDNYKGLRKVNFHVTSGIANNALKSYDSAVPHLKSAPKYDYGYATEIDRSVVTSNNLYNNDYSSINNVMSLSIYDWNKKYNDESLYRINRCVEKDNETAYTGWRTWLTNDYYETVRNKGLTTNIVGIDRDLLIQHEQSMFITVGNEQMNINNSEAFIGAGNIFDRQAIELAPDKKGSFGSKYVIGSHSNSFGYLTVDVERGKIYLVSNREAPIVISDLGMSLWFFNNLKYSNKLYYNSTNFIEIPDDNPYTGFGFNITTDTQYERVIISKKCYSLTETAKLAITLGILQYSNFRWILTQQDSTLKEIPWEDTVYFKNEGFTISFDLANKVFTFFHDYFPDRLYNLRGSFYAVKNKPLSGNKSTTSRVFKCNYGKKGIYDNTSIVDIDGSQIELATPFKFYIVPVFNLKGYEKHFFNLQWLTEVYNHNNYLLKDKTITSLLAFNDYQCTGEKIIVPFDFNNYFESNARLIKTHWSFNDLRDMLRLDISTNPNPPVPFIVNYSELNNAITPINNNKPFETQRPLISNWLAVKFSYDNEIVDNNSKEIRILEAVSEFVPTGR